MPPAVVWFRRDLRLHDNPALIEALETGNGSAVAVFVVDPSLWRPAGPVRRAYLARALRALDASLSGRLVVLHGPPGDVLPALARRLRAPAIHVAADYGPYGAERDVVVAQRLEALGIPLVRTGSSYAVAPGRVTKADGTPYRVYTPFQRAWLAHGWRRPAPAPGPDVDWIVPHRREALPDADEPRGVRLPPAGEAAALDRWHAFVASGALERYAGQRDRPDLVGTSVMSAALRWGEIHPRTLLADLGDGAGHEVFRKELAWREFYADVLHHQPASARTSLRTELADIEVDEGSCADERFAAWADGRTGFPFVDSGMRQLRAEGWMHNRLRMVTASFLVKDLHVDWTRGARHFMQGLRDGDLASNQHGWQWVAGTGTDAAPYFRVFNPVAQGLRYDPEGAYVRRYVPELAGLDGPAVHEPWNAPGGLPDGYPVRIVDHTAEREVSLARYSEVRARFDRPSPPA